MTWLRITVNEVKWRHEKFSIFCAVCACLSVGQTSNPLHPTWVVKGIPQAPLVSNNNFCRVTRTAEVKGLTDTRSDQHFFLLLLHQLTHQRNIYRMNVSASTPPFQVWAQSISRIVGPIEDVSFIPGPHMQGDLITSEGYNNTAPNYPSELLLHQWTGENRGCNHNNTRCDGLFVWSKAVRRLYLFYSNLTLKKEKKKTWPAHFLEPLWK